MSLWLNLEIYQNILELYLGGSYMPFRSLYEYWITIIINKARF